jgi:hypothetical protein
MSVCPATKAIIFLFLVAAPYSQSLLRSSQRKSKFIPKSTFMHLHRELHISHSDKLVSRVLQSFFYLLFCNQVSVVLHYDRIGHKVDVYFFDSLFSPQLLFNNRLAGCAVHTHDFEENSLNYHDVIWICTCINK